TDYYTFKQYKEEFGNNRPNVSEHTKLYFVISRLFLDYIKEYKDSNYATFDLPQDDPNIRVYLHNKFEKAQDTSYVRSSERMLLDQKYGLEFKKDSKQLKEIMQDSNALKFAKLDTLFHHKMIDLSGVYLGAEKTDRSFVLNTYIEAQLSKTFDFQSELDYELSLRGLYLEKGFLLESPQEDKIQKAFHNKLQNYTQCTQGPLQCYFSLRNEYNKNHNLVILKYL
ncbi:hypothetical protein MJH12_05770, partial [bacterium]|nr:hypothetical protein [bacterium]